MAKKSDDVKSISKSKKQAVKTTAKRVAKPTQTKSAATRKPAATPKQMASPRTRIAASNKLTKDKDRNFVVSGQVTYADKQPAIGVEVVAVDLDVASEDVLGTTLSNNYGHYSITFTAAKFKRTAAELGGPELVVHVYDQNGEEIGKSRRVSNAGRVTDLNVEIKHEAPKLVQVQGKIISRSRAGVGGLRVEIVDKNIDGDVCLAQSLTAEDGSYAVNFSMVGLLQRGKQQADLQALVFTGEVFLGSSEVRYNGSVHEVLDVVLSEESSTELPSEYETLLPALTRHFKGKLRDLKESDGQLHITYLANKSGWDARAVALAVLADQFSEFRPDNKDATGIAAPLYYALFRAGFSANPDTLFNADAETLKRVWKSAIEQGVIPKSLKQAIPNAVKVFQKLGAQNMLANSALVGASSMTEMLSFSGLDGAERERFADLYVAHRTDLNTFWDKIGNALGKTKRDRLRVDGKLGFVTINNVPLIQKLHARAGDSGITDPLQLAQTGYHSAKQWDDLLTGEVPIPQEIPGETSEAKRTNYAEYLAAQIRLSYPTASVAEMVKSRAISLITVAPGIKPEAAAPKSIADDVHGFLTAQQGRFEIGMQPVQQYIAQNKLQVSAEVVHQVKRLQRVYQITPNDRALIGMMKSGVDAAYHVVRYDKNTFVQNFATDLGGADHAAMTYDKSVQVHNVVLNIALGYLSARTAPAIGVHSPAGVIDPVPHASDVIASATLESLFGSMDFCECAHCRSILSPAAYLVDLLLFLQSDDQVWTGFRDAWKQKHGQAPYPFVDQVAWNKFNSDWNAQHPGQPLPQTGISPFEVLMSRRPDIQHLPLTCENTNIALPYIDVVNETLEYFVANDSQKLSLKDYGGHDTNGVASEDLLASPQFVRDTAYTTLRNEYFPAPLPFHQPLENLRRYFNKFEVPLSLAMERLRTSDDLERTTNPYGWRDILMEQLGLSRDEYEILTNTTTVPLWRMYGFSNLPSAPADAVVIAGLSNAKHYARRLKISYEDLIAILKTRFINPNAYLIPKLERLGVSFADLKALKDATGNSGDAAFDTLLVKLAVPPDPAEYGGDIKAWVKQQDNYDRIMGLVTLAIPASAWVASKVYSIGDCVRPTPTQSVSSLYYECTTAGTSASAQPNWPTTPGSTCSDGTNNSVAWICRDASSCPSFDNLAFRYSDPAKLSQNIGPAEFVRLLRFICLWKKLGWSIEQTDAAICALYRADLDSLDASDVDTVTKLNAGFLTMLPRLGIAMRVMQALNLTVKRDLLPLLTCWSEIGTHGDTALYRQMFLNPAILEQGPVFADNGYGEVLTDASQMLPTDDSQQIARVAGTIKTDDILTTLINDVAIPYKVVAGDTTISILAANIVLTINGVTTADTVTGLPLNQVIVASNTSGVITIKARNQGKPVKLSCSLSFGATETYVGLDHKSALRSAFNLSGNEYDQIVTALGYDANTVLTISNISAIYRRGWLARKLKLSVRELLLLIQFTGLDPFAVPNPKNPAILQLIALIQAMKDRSLNPAAALYMVWNQDLSGKSVPDAAQVAAFARMLRLSFSAIESEFSVHDDPDGAILQARMALVYGVDTAAFFFGLLNGTFVTEVPYGRNQVPLLTQVSCSRGHVAIVSYVSYKHHQATLEQTILDVAPGLISYDDSTERLTFTGVLSQAKVNDLKAVAATAIIDSAVSVLFQAAVEQLHEKNKLVVSANLEQSIVDAAPGLVYSEINSRLSVTGALYGDTVNALKAVSATAISDINARGSFLAALQILYEENQKVIKANLEQPIADAGQGNIAYDDFRKQLSYTGVLSATMCSNIKQAAGAGAVEFNKAMDALYKKSHAVIEPFFARYPELQSHYDVYINSSGPVTTKRQVLLGLILPELVSGRKKQQALQSISAVASTDLAFAQTLLDAPNDNFPLHAGARDDQSALHDMLGLETSGLSVQFFANNTAEGTIISGSPSIAVDINYAPEVDGVGNPLPGNPVSTSAISGIWCGYLEAPENGLFNLHIEADTAATVTLLLDNKPVALTKNGANWTNATQLELRAGTLYPVVLTVNNVRDKLRVQWEWRPKGQGRGIIPSRYLYPATLFEHFQKTYVRFLKAASLATGLGLTANEMAYFATYPDYHINAQGQLVVTGKSWLNALPVNGDPSSATAVALLKPFRALLDYARIKADLAPNDERLLAVCEDPVTAKNSGLLQALTRWESNSLDTLLIRLGKVDGGNPNYKELEYLDTFMRVYDALALARKMGVSTSALINAATNEPVGSTVRDLQSALRARYDTASWRDVVKPINDEMRSLQRDALVAYILHQMSLHPASAHIDTPEKLFEYFLMDVEMEPCMQTSRIRHALSSVQLFIERSLMNLEPRVSPAAINAKQWAWMKRYRVWEANRKVYLYPENWLEPELRDDKSPFFKEIESELLQGDITEDSASTALLNYLAKLEEVAKLEPCGIYHIEADSALRKGEIDHVVARTAGANRNYYYRRREGGAWTPWEQIKLEIEDNPVIPVVWNDRLFLFWLRILEQAPLTVPAQPETGTNSQDIFAASIFIQPMTMVQAVLCWSEYYNGKWQSTKTSDVSKPVDLGQFSTNAFDRSALRLSVSEESDVLKVIVSGQGKTSWFSIYNTHSLPVPKEPNAPLAIIFGQSSRILGISAGCFTIVYNRGIVIRNPDGTWPDFALPRRLLKNSNPIPFHTTEPRHGLKNPWDAPFFYEDSRHVFYVSTAESMVPVPQWNDIGVVVRPPKLEGDLPLLVLGELENIKDPGGPVTKQPGFGVTDPTPIERFVTEDAYIHRGIGSAGTVQFDGKEIGLTGSQMNSEILK